MQKLNKNVNFYVLYRAQHMMLHLFQLYNNSRMGMFKAVIFIYLLMT